MNIVAITDLNKDCIKSFDCGNEELNCYFKEYAIQNNVKNVSRTFVLEDGGEVLGYYSLANAQIGFESINNDLKKGLPKYPIPAIRLARLAVSINYQRKGFGTILLKNAFLRVLGISNQSGLCFVIVDAKDSAKTFYEQFGFVKISSSQFTYLLPVSTIKKAFIKQRQISFEKSESGMDITRECAMDAIKSIREKADKDGVSNMSLDEINEEINKVRHGK